jgi:hypothetical protein
MKSWPAISLKDYGTSKNHDTNGIFWGGLDFLGNIKKLEC